MGRPSAPRVSAEQSRRLGRLRGRLYGLLATVFSQFSPLLMCAEGSARHCGIGLVENFPNLLGNVVGVVKTLSVLLVGRTTFGWAETGAEANGISAGSNAGDVSRCNSSTDRIGTGDLSGASLGIGGGVGYMNLHTHKQARWVYPYFWHHHIAFNKIGQAACERSARKWTLCLKQTHVSVTSTLSGHLLPAVPLVAVAEHERLQFCDVGLRERVDKTVGTVTRAPCASTIERTFLVILQH